MLSETIKRLEAVDVEKIKEEYRQRTSGSVYPFVAGALQAYFNEAMKTIRALSNELDEATRRKDALELAAETVLNDSDVSVNQDGTVYELLYSAADVIEDGFTKGLSLDQIRGMLNEGIDDEELAVGHFIR